MVAVRPFRALRPPSELAGAVAALPYDVMNTAEAVAMAAGNPDHFLHVSRPEIDFPIGTDPHAPQVYAAGRVALDSMVARGTLVRDATPTFSVYRQQMGDHTQIGIALTASVADYLSGDIRIHEHTRPDKELDRVRHIEALGAHDEPVFLVGSTHPALERVVAAATASEPVADVTSDDGIRHTVWVLDQDGAVGAVTAAFAKIGRLYVADGHHRSAAAARVAESGPVGSQWFLAVVIPVEQTLVLPYHRVVALAGRRASDILAAIDQVIGIREVSAAVQPTRGSIGITTIGRWYSAQLPSPPSSDPVAALDVAILQDRVLGPLLGIADPRVDPTIELVGGIRGLAELERRASHDAIAFAMAPTPMDQLLAVADSGAVMPPKSTWFEPKLRSGLFLNTFE